MRKFILFIFFICSFAFAKEDYSEMSTQELIAIMGYVKSENKKEFKNELASRVSTMTSNERAQYKQNLDKLNK